MNIKEALLKTSAGPQWTRIGIDHHHGIDLPLSALHSKSSCGIGEFYDLIPLIDWCHTLGMDVIQLLPLNDTGDDTSPFFAVSAMALSPLYLSLHKLPGVDKTSLLEMQALNTTPRVCFHQVQAHKLLFLRHYFEHLGPMAVEQEQLERYTRENPWVKTYALFKVLKDLLSKNHWLKWPSELKNLSAARLAALTEEHSDKMRFYIFLQYLCYTQLKEVKKHAEKKGVLLKGDIPILVSPDSADLWEHTDAFDLNFSAGAPPDIYHSQGQYWGLPLFKWDVIRERQFDWWKRRLCYAGNFYDIYRIDHVLGLFRIWSIPLGAPPCEGKFIPEDQATWLKRGMEILSVFIDHSPMLPIAEDLGTVPQSVRQVLTELGICGTKVIRWEMIDEERFVDLLHYNPISMTTVSTHDSDTLETWWLNDPRSKLYAQSKGWTWGSRLTKGQRRQILWDSHHSSSLFHINLIGEYLALFDELVWDDPEDERINRPGRVSDKNWTYRIRPCIEELTNHVPLKEAIKELLS